MIVRRAMKILVLFALGGAVGFLMSHRADQPRSTGDDAILQQMLPDVQIGSTTYGGLEQYLRKLCPNVIVDWPILRDRRIYPGTPITLDLHLHHVTVEQLLSKLSDSLGRDNSRIDCYVDDGIAVLYDYEFQGRDIGVNRETDMRVYDVRQLILTDGPWEKLALDNEGNTATGRPEDQWERRDRLIATIKHVVDPNGWSDDSQSGTGSIQIYKGRLYVTQSPQNLDAVGEVISILRSAR